MISVIVSTYNRPIKLRRAIQSILNQTYQDFEIIVVDDASTEHFVLQSDDRIHLIQLDINSGTQAKPKNVGIMASRGEYIAFLDDDNEYRPDHLQVLLDAIKESNVDIVYGDRMVVEDSTGQMMGIGVNSDFNPPLLMQRNYIDTSDFLIKRDTLLAIGGWDERSKRMLDWNLMVRLLKYGASFKHVPQVITDYYLHDDMLSNKPETKAWDTVNVDVVLPFLNNVIKEPKVAIFSITYERLDYTKKCFKSLYDTIGYPFDHYIVDNGSKDGTVKYLKDNFNNPNQFCIFNEENKGISIASNQAIDAIKKKEYDIIIKVDNDCLFKSKYWLSKMIDIWKCNRRMALSLYVEGLRDNPGGAPRLVYGQIKGELIGITKHLGGICHFVDARAYDKFRWNEDSTLHGIQDLELSNYLLKNGYQMGYLENWFCEHYEGTDGQEKRYPEYFERRKKEKTTKYRRTYEDIQEAESASSRGTMWGDRVKDSIARFEQYFNGRVLDIGCNDGLGIEILGGLGFMASGIDISKQRIAVASANGLDVKRGYMENLPYSDKIFDTIFCSHTLEHSKNINKASREIQRVGKRLILVVPIEEATQNPGHTSPITSPDEVKKLFKGTILHEEELNRYEKEYVLIMDLE